MTYSKTMDRASEPAAMADTTEETPHVRLTGLTKRFGSSFAVRDLDLSIAKGEILALLGPSGCGKTTALRCIAGLERIDGGEISIAGRVVATREASLPPHRRGIGFVFQSYALWPHMSVLKNVVYGLRRLGVGRAERDRRAREVLDVVGLSGLEARLPGELSGGQQQRVALARSLVVNPTVLLLDEPLSNLDAVLRDRMRKDLRKILKEVGITSVFVTHDQREAFGVCDRVALMNAGSLVQVDRPEVLYEHPADEFVASMLGSSNLVPVSGITVRDGLTTCVTADGRTLEATSSPRHPLDAAEGTVFFRPDDAVVTTEPPGSSQNVWSGVVTSRIYEGANVELAVRSDDSEFRVLAPAVYAPAEGASVWLHVPASRLQIIGSAS